MKLSKRIGLFVVALVLAGCSSGLYGVRGKVVFEDGTPLDGGMVVFEHIDGAAKSSADGPINTDGTFQLRTDAGEGVRAGKYRVLVRPKARPTPELKRLPLVIHPKFERFETSGIELVVEPKSNTFEIKVAKP